MTRSKKYFLILMILLANTFAAPSVSGLPDEPAKHWKIDLKDAQNIKNRSTDIEILHAEEGKYLGAQKSKEGILIFQGGIIVKLRNYTLYADTVKINPDTGEIYGEGEVTLVDGLQVMRGSKFIFDNRLGAGVLYAIDGYFKPLYVMGELSKVTGSKNLIIAASYLSTCEVETPHYFLKAQKIWLQENNRFIALGVIYYVGQLPVFYLPFVIQTDLGTGIHTLFGSNTSRGLFMQNSYFFGFSNNPVLPANGVLMFDFYQYDGTYFGTYLGKKSPFLNYDMYLGIAFWTKKEVTNSTTQPFTNDILQSDGSFQKITTNLYEINVMLHTKWNSSFEKDSKSSVDIQLEQYNNRYFGNMFGERIVPSSSLESISTSEMLGKKVAKSDLKWKLIYTENWLDNSFQVMLQRLQRWDGHPTSLGGVDTYNIQNDIFPSLLFRKNWYVVKPSGKIFQGIKNEISISAGIQKDYQEGLYYRTLNSANMKSGLNAYFPFHELISFQPSVGYGIKGQFYNVESVAQHLENTRKTYQYIYNVDSLYLGPSFFKLGAIYSLQLAIQPRYPDPFFFNETGNYSEMENKAYFTLGSDFAPYGSITLGTSRDLRLFPGNPGEPIYWDPIFTSVFFDYDFINKDNLYLPENTLRDNFYMGIGFDETLLYNIKFNTFGANSLTFYFQTGGYQFLFFDKIQLLKAGIYWYHNFLNPYKNDLQLYFQTKVAFLKYWYIDFLISSSAPSLGAPSDPYQSINNFLNNSLNPENSPFYLDNFSISLGHDLHDWTMTLTYALRQVWIPFSNNINFAGYYEHQVFLSFNLKGLGGMGADKFQLYNFNPRENRDLYGIY